MRLESTVLLKRYFHESVQTEKVYHKNESYELKKCLQKPLHINSASFDLNDLFPLESFISWGRQVTK